MIGDTDHFVEDEQGHSHMEKDRSPCGSEVGKTMPQVSGNVVLIEELSSGDFISNAAGIKKVREAKKYPPHGKSLFNLR